MRMYVGLALRRFRLWFLFCVIAVSVVAAAEKKPVLLYTRYFNAEGENRYSPDTTYKDILDHLRTRFDVRVDSGPLTQKSLADVNVILIANPSDKAVDGHAAPHHFGTADIDAIEGFVQWHGGGVIVMGNQAN